MNINEVLALEESFGTQMNVIKDVTFEGRILEQIQSAVAYIQTQIKERTYLTSGGVFTTEQEYPEFVRTELVVNAVAHRDYSITGTEIQIKMFDDHLVVESPGNLPKMVKIEKMRESHFARNSHIAEYLKSYKYVKDFGEGVDRMCREMEEAGLPKPEYSQVAFILKATVKNIDFGAEKVEKSGVTSEKTGFTPQKTGFGQQKRDLNNIIQESNFGKSIKTKLSKILADIEKNQVISAKDVMKSLDCKPTAATENIKRLVSLGVLEKVEGFGHGKYILKNEE